jgi:hypothetical protein
MGLFNTLIAVPEEGITAQELSQKTNSDEIFISKDRCRNTSMVLN